MWVERLPSGKWRGCYRDPDGAKRGRTFPNKTMARHWATEQEAAVTSQRWRDPSAGRVTVKEYAAQWWADRVTEASTAANDRYRLDTHVLPEWADKRLGLILPSHVQGWVKRLQTTDSNRGQPMSAGSVIACHGLLRSILEQARKDGLIESNPATGVSLPRPPARARCS